MVVFEAVLHPDEAARYFAQPRAGRYHDLDSHRDAPWGGIGDNRCLVGSGRRQWQCDLRGPEDAHAVRVVEARDAAPRLQVPIPGCNARAFLEGHHLEHWADGGATTLDNVIALCSFHHRFVHEYGFTLELDVKTNVVSAYEPARNRWSRAEADAHDDEDESN